MIYQRRKQCGKEWYDVERSHCPECGAKMEGGAENDKNRSK